MWNNPTNKQQQRGAVTLITALVVLVMLSLLALVGSRVALVQQRVTTNNAEAVTAHAAAQAGLQAAMAYLVENKSSYRNWSWQNCSGASGKITQFCQNHASNNSWQYVAIQASTTALPNLNNGYTYKVWYLSNMLNQNPLDTSLTGECTTLLGGGGALSTALDKVTGKLSDAVNDLLGSLTNILNPLLGKVTGSLTGANSQLLPALGLPPVGDLCLPINITQVPAVPPPSQINPTIEIVVTASPNNGSSGGSARIQIAMQPTSLFKNIPIAAIMASNDVILMGDVRVWGNPRPPTTNPDFSTINLENISLAGLPLGGIIDSAGKVTSNVLGPILNPIADPLLKGLLGTTTDDLLDLDLNVTFPLSIWAGGGVALLPKLPNPNDSTNSGNQPDNNCDSYGWLGGLICEAVDTVGDVLKDAFEGVSSLIEGVSNLLEETPGLKGIGKLFGGVNDVVALLENTTTGLTDRLSNLASDNGSGLDLGILLQSSRTCLPPWPGFTSTGTDDNTCTVLSQSATVLKGEFNQDTWEKSGFLPVNVKLPDIQANGKSTGISTGPLLSSVTQLLKECNNPKGCHPFPDGEGDPDGDGTEQSSLFEYTFGIKNNQSSTVENASVTDNACSSFNSSDNVLYWSDQNKCKLDASDGTIGSESAPVILIADGNITLEPGITVYGIIYMLGGGNVSIDDQASGSGRATIRGALLADGASGKVFVKGPINIVYDQSIIRKVGFRAGGFATIPGSWKDWSAS